MTKMLSRLFERLSALPDDQQDAIAARVLAELEDGRIWDELFATSQASLQELAEEARQELREGKAAPGDW